VTRGCIQVMEGRRCFAHLTVEENLLTGAFTRRDGKAAVAADLESGLFVFPAAQRNAAARPRATHPAASSRCAAVGRALMSRPKMILLDEPSMGLRRRLSRKSSRSSKA